MTSDNARRESRDRLFRTSKPTIRKLEEDDLPFIRLSQKMLGIEMNEEDFQKFIDGVFSSYNEVWIIEDNNAKFGAGFGPVGVMCGQVIGNTYEPHAEWFEWSSPKNILRGTVAFLQKSRYRHIGVIVVHALNDSTAFFRRLRKYVRLYYVGKIPDGDRAGRGDDYIYFQRCLT